VREPEVARPALLVLLALLLVVPLLGRAGWPSVAGAAFLLEFLSEGRVPALSALTRPPSVRPLAVPGVVADLYTGAECARPPRDPTWAGRPCSLVLVHGLAPTGKNDPRLRRAARLLARAGFAVAVPTVTGLARFRLDPDDVEPVVRTLQAMPPPATLVGISVGAGPALVAAADPRVSDRVAVVLSLGGYASASALARFYLTARPDLARRFAEANPALMADPTARRAVATGDLAGLSPELRRRLDAVSPERVVGGIRARLLIVHGRDDPLVPFTESLRLADAARALHPRLALVGAIAHVEGAPGRGRPADLLGLWLIARELIAGPAGAL
jgi:pimeloyl-ACP methyl ester carboxylesterase